MPIDSFERYPLLFGPSPVHPLERLSRHLGGASIWAKREDCNSYPSAGCSPITLARSRRSLPGSALNACSSRKAG